MPRPTKILDLLERVRLCLSTGRYRITYHAQLRQRQRFIGLPELIFVLNTGRHEKSHDKFDEAFKVWNYAIRGHSANLDDIRVIVSFDEENLLIITAFCVEREDRS